MISYMRGGRSVPGLAVSVPRVALPDDEDWRWDACTGPADPDVVEHARVHIERDGWTIVGSHTRSYMYSVGLTRRGWPELVMRVRTVSTETAGAVLCEVVRLCEADQVAPADGQVRSITGFRVAMAAVDDRLVPRICQVAGALYGGGPVRAVELSLGDRAY